MGVLRGEQLVAKQPNSDQYFNKLLQENNKRKKEFFTKADNFLEKVGFFDLKFEKRLEQLNHEKILKIIQVGVKENLSLVEIAKVFRFNTKDFIDQMSIMPEIADAITLGYAERNTEIEDAVYKLAKGYDYEEKTEYKTITGNREFIKETTVHKHAQPNFNAARWYLQYRNKQEFSPVMKEIAEIESKNFKIKVNFAGADSEDE